MSRSQRIAVHYSPGAELQDISKTVGAQLVQTVNWINALVYSFTGATLTAQTCELESASVTYLSCATGNIGSISTQFINCYTGHVNNLSSEIGNIGVLYTNTSLPITGYAGSYMVINSVTGSSAFFSTFRGSDVYAGISVRAPSVTGSSAFFSTITGTNIYSNYHSSPNANFSYMDIDFGHFSLLLADAFTLPSSIIVQNFDIFDTFTGTNMSSGNITEQAVYCNTITGTSAFFTTINGTSLRYGSQLSIKNYIGSSSFFTTITGTNIYSTIVKSPSFVGPGMYISSQTISTEITGVNIYSVQAISPIITGYTVNISSLVTSPSLKADTIISYTLGQPVSIAGVKFNYSYIIALSRLLTTQPLATRATTYWTSSNASSSREWRAVSWSPELGILCSVSGITGSDGQVQISSNGTTWTSETTIPIAQNWYDICWSPEKKLFVACGGDGSPITQFMYSSDGSNWSGTILSIGTVETLCYSPELGIFCGLSASSNVSVISSDGVNWTTYSFPASLTSPKVCYASELNLFCCVFGNGSAVGNDGINWTTSGSSSNMNDVCWSPFLDLFCSIGINEVATSSDGLNWTTNSFNMNGERICWSPELAILTSIGDSSGNGAIGYSLNGLNWTSLSSPNNIVFNGICWARELGIFSAVSTSLTMISRYVKKCY
jgi:hypothetical protein